MRQEGGKEAVMLRVRSNALTREAWAASIWTAGFPDLAVARAVSQSATKDVQNECSCPAKPN